MPSSLTPFERFRQALAQHGIPQGKPRGDGWFDTRCPAHKQGKEKRNSLSYRERDNLELGVSCHTGCDYVSIMEAVGLKKSDGYPKSSRSRQPAPDFVFPYHNLDGSLAFEVHRFELGNGKKTFKQRRPHMDKWEDKIRVPEHERVIYQLPEIAKAIKDKRVIWFVEGEKNANSLRALGFPATCVAGGSSARWLPQFSAALEGAPVLVIVQDRDLHLPKRPGAAFARRVARKALEVVDTVKLVELPGVPDHGGDATDFIDARPNPEQAKADLIEVIEKTPAWSPDQEKPVDAQGDEPKTRYLFTDLGNAHRFLDKHGDRVRHVGEWAGGNGSRPWVIYDRGRWAQDNVGEVRTLAQECLEGIYRNAETGPEREWGFKCQTGGKTSTLLNMARDVRGIGVSASIFDTDPMALNCLNGTVDLATGRLRHHRAGDYHMHQVQAEYHEGAKAPEWEAMLQRVFEKRPELPSFIQRAVGYSLTGKTSEQVFFVCHGGGANGKGTILGNILEILGSYAQAAQSALWMAKTGDRDLYELADLMGARFVTASELPQGEPLDERLIKEVTGGDRIKARQIFCPTFEYKPQFKVWMMTNHKPRIRSQDHGIWRRVIMIPFEKEFPKESWDKDLDAKLQAEWPGILAWAIEGAAVWADSGLGVPGCVHDATAKYRKEMDSLSGFLDDCCQVGEGNIVLASLIWNTYKNWARSSNTRAMTKKSFEAALEERKFEKRRDSAGRRWHGITVTVAAEDEHADHGKVMREEAEEAQRERAHG